ncbi:DGQHR domain-containing protein [Priestia megaterium]
MPLLTIEQKGLKFYLFSYDPREIIKLISIVDNDKTQKYQRPWKESRVKEIATYLSGKRNLDFSKSREAKKAKGILPNCPILNVKDDSKIIHENGQSYVLLPETDEEISTAKGEWEILDGQHRLISFNDEYAKKAGFNDHVYTMGYVLFNNLSFQEKKEIFIVANVKQEKVERNILRFLMRYLGILSDTEIETDLLVQTLNDSKDSPLAGRISVEGEKIPHGFKLIQVSKIFQNSNTMSTLGSRSIDVKKLALFTYLKAWSEVYKDKFNNPQHTLGKISGLRYIMYLFPFISEILEKNKLVADVKNLSKILAVLKKDILPESFFALDNDEHLLFRAETSTIALARKHGQLLKDTYVKSTEHFDPYIQKEANDN